MDKEIKIKTPYGTKNWSFVKKCFDSHEELLEACKWALNTMNEFNMLLPDNKLSRVIAKAEGN